MSNTHESGSEGPEKKLSNQLFSLSVFNRERAAGKGILGDLKAGVKEIQYQASDKPVLQQRNEQLAIFKHRVNKGTLYPFQRLKKVEHDAQVLIDAATEITPEKKRPPTIEGMDPEQFTEAVRALSQNTYDQLLKDVEKESRLKAFEKVRRELKKWSDICEQIKFDMKLESKLTAARLNGITSPFEKVGVGEWLKKESLRENNTPSFSPREQGISRPIFLGEGQRGNVLKAFQRGSEIVIKAPKKAFNTPEESQQRIREFEITKDLQGVPELLTSTAIYRVNSDEFKEFEEAMTLLQYPFFKGKEADEYMEGKFEKPSAARNTEAIQIIQQLLKGVKAMHANAVIHRDIKPENILVNEEGIARLADFGEAEWEGNIPLKSAGSPTYMPLDQLNGEASTAQMDVYALGVSLYVLMTGDKNPFEIASLESFEAVQEAIAHKEEQRDVPRLSSFSDEKLKRIAGGYLRKVIQKATSPDESHQYRNLEEMEEDLEKALRFESDMARKHETRKFKKLQTQEGQSADQEAPSQKPKPKAKKPTGEKVSGKSTAFYDVDQFRPGGN